LLKVESVSDNRNITVRNGIIFLIFIYKMIFTSSSDLKVLKFSPGGAELARQADAVCAADSNEALYQPAHQQA
jgi:hypothetical protein